MYTQHQKEVFCCILLALHAHYDGKNTTSVKYQRTKA